MSSFDESSLLGTFCLDENTPPHSDDENSNQDVVVVDTKKDEPKPKKPRVKREPKAKPESKDKPVKQLKEKYESIKHKSPFTKTQQLPFLPEEDDKKL